MKTKKLSALLMTLIMVLSLMAIPALSESEAETEPTVALTDITTSQPEDDVDEGEATPTDQDTAMMADIAEDEVCDLCGGAPKASGFLAVDDVYHVSVCEHGKIVPNSKEEHQDELHYDETEHWYVCKDCGYVYGLGDHWAECTNPNTCANCGAPYTGDNISHYFDYGNYQYDETGHWCVCMDCGQEEEHEPHYALCTDPNTCPTCGAPYTGDNIEHHFDRSTFKYNETEHWQVCLDCGQEDTHWKHAATCTDPNTCETCGAPCTDVLIQHDYYTEKRYDETDHWLVCKDCGNETKHLPHFAMCDAPDKCAECGAPYAGDAIDHYAVSQEDYTYTETTHTYICPGCGQSITGEHEMDDEGECYLCGYSPNANPTAEPQNTPEPTATPAPTKKPASDNGDVNIPKTGDTSSMTLWYVVMFASVAVGIATVLVSKKRKFNR